MVNKINFGDCLKLMNDISDESVDMILCDLPYGTTKCKWDTIIPFEPLWEQYKRVIKDNGAIVLTASQPFTSALVMSNPNWFKYEWIWHKNRGSNFALLKYQPFKEHESILVFSKNTHKYYPIRQERSQSGKNRANYSFKNAGGGEATGFVIKDDGVRRTIEKDLRAPSSIQKFNTEVGMHPTQKPVALFEYLIKTYTHEGDTVLDNCSGSGTTAIACMTTNRNYICIENNKQYFENSNHRVELFKSQNIDSALGQ
jgi:site-specific DNA-methyltransferase (adenine-specific)